MRGGAVQFPSGLVFDERAHVVSFEALATRKEFKLDDEDQSGDRAAQILDQIDDGARRAASGEQVVGDQDAMALSDGVAVNLQRVLPVLKIVRDGGALCRELARLAHGHKARAQVISQRRGEDEPARLYADYRIDLDAIELRGERVNRPAQPFGLLEQRRNVIEINPGLRKVRHFANHCFEFVHKVWKCRTQDSGLRSQNKKAFAFILTPES